MESKEKRKLNDEESQNQRLSITKRQKLVHEIITEQEQEQEQEQKEEQDFVNFLESQLMDEEQEQEQAIAQE